MRVASRTVPVLLAAVCLWSQSPGPLLDQARTAQSAGDFSKAKATLFQAAKQFPDDVSVARAEARMLDASGDPGRRDAYKRLLDLLKQNGQEDRSATRRLAILDLAAYESKAGGLNLPGYQSFQPPLAGSAT